MWYFIGKVLISAVLIGIVSEVAKRLPTLGALLASLPLVSVLAMLWMYREGVGKAVIATHAEATFWYVLPSLPMFLLLPWLLRHGVGFYVSLAISCCVTMLLYIGVAWLARWFGVQL